MSESKTHHTRPSWARVAGFASYQAFVYAAFYSGTNHQLILGPFSIERAELFLALVFMVAAFIGERLAFDSAERALSRSGTLAAFAAFMSAGAAVAAAPGTSAAEVVGEGLLIGAPMALTLMAWGKVLGENPPRLAATEIFAATGVACAFCIVLWFLPKQVALAFRCVLPFAGVAFMEIAKNTSPDTCAKISTQGGAASAHGRKLSSRMLAGSALFGLAAGFIETYRSDPGLIATPDLPYSMFIVGLFCVGALEMLKPANEGAQGDFSASYRIAFSLMIAGFLFTPVLADFDITGDSVVLGGYLGLTAAFASLFCAAAQLEGSSCALAFAQGFAMLYGGEAAGIFLANGFDALSPTHVTPYAVVAMAGLMVAISYVFLFTERDFRELSTTVDAYEQTEEVRDAIAAAAGLSAREKEVLALALRGRTNERIAQELFIAKSTADTHLRRIYSKCGVHSRQELLDMAETTASKIRARRN